MHLAEAFTLMSQDDKNVFSEMSGSDYSAARKIIIDVVLCTDLAVHLQLVGSLKTSIASQNNDELTADPIILMKVILKLADIGHSTKEIHVHVKWTCRIIEEFFLQGDEEKKSNMPVSPFMDRFSEHSATNQVGFFDFIILPFIDVAAQTIFSHAFDDIVQQTRTNYQFWKTAEQKKSKLIDDITREFLK